MFEDLPLTMARARAIWDKMDKERQVPAPALHPRTVSVPREEAQVNSSVDSSISFRTRTKIEQIIIFPIRTLFGDELEMSSV